MSSAEWNVLGLLLDFVGLLLLIRYGVGGTQGRNRSWLGLALFVAGTTCQIWAHVRWIG